MIVYKISMARYFFLFLLIGLWAANSSAENIAADLRKAWPNTDFSKTTINLSKVTSAGVPKDGIPAINRPRFISIKQARKWVSDKEPVITTEVKGEARAYPLQIMVYHQVINDKIKGTPLLISFCPLCNSGFVYNRNVGSRTLNFDTTGLLRNSGLIMYDRETETWWQQFTGEAIVGEYAGKQLMLEYPSHLISFSEFAKRYPKGKVLSRDTGFRRKYGLNPFRGYDSIDNSPFLLKDKSDPRLPPMERVLNVRIGESHKLYPYSMIKISMVINDSFANTPVVVLSQSAYLSPLDKLEITQSKEIPAAAAYDRRINGKALTFKHATGKITDSETGSNWNMYGEAINGELKGTRLQRIDIGAHFAFAALAFQPKCEIYSK